MKESDAIAKWIKAEEKKNPRAFIYKIPDTTRCSFGHPVGAGKKPFDVITVGAAGCDSGYWEFKVSDTKAPANALRKLANHQIDALVRIGADAEHGTKAGCIVYHAATKSFYTYCTGTSCQHCELKYAPNFNVCERCPISVQGRPNLP